MKPALAGALIAGGRSSRFGAPKARLELGLGRGSLGAHLLAEMRRAGLGPLVFNGSEVPEDLPADVAVLPDRERGRGPLEGLASVLAALDRPVLVAACDLPGLDAAAFSDLAGAWVPGRGGLVARGKDGWHPLLGIYEPSLLPEMEARLARGERALHRLVEAAGLDAWSAQERWLVNVNTQEEWRRWSEGQGGNR